jgi:hypothetical protein
MTAAGRGDMSRNMNQTNRLKNNVTKISQRTLPGETNVKRTAEDFHHSEH